jgi:hypothetical protein
MGGSLEKVVGAMGFEPMTPASRTLCADQTALRPDVMIHYKGLSKISKA